MQQNLIPIQSLDIEAETKISFDLYVNLPLNNKYLLYRRKGGQLESSRLENFSANNMATFYIQREDYKEFVKYVAGRINSLVGVTSNEDSQRIMTASVRAILTSTFCQTDPAVINAMMGNLNDITHAVIESALETSGRANKKTFLKLTELARVGSDFQKHPVNTASLAVLITFGIGYSSEKTLSDISMASLLHDIGLSKLETKVIAKAHDVLSLTPLEREGLYQHPEYTLQILKEKGVILSDVAQTIIRQHHEEFNGYGYPAGLRGYNINELSQILRVADDLDQLATAAGFSGTNASQAPLRARVEAYLDLLHLNKIIEPNLLARIRKILV